MVGGAPSVVLDGVCVQGRTMQAFGPLDLALAPHGLTILLGPNGAGKTSLLKVLHGMQRIAQGQVRWSMPDAQLRPLRAYVFQKPVMLRRTLRENIAYPLALKKVGKAQIDAAVAQWAQHIGLDHALDRPATRLSGGEQQKVALARALVCKPQVLLLDEPCANLDGHSTREIEALLKTAHAAGTRIIMATHDLGQARRLATDIVFLVNGRLCEQADADTFFAGRGSAQARAFLNGEIVG